MNEEILKTEIMWFSQSSESKEKVYKPEKVSLKPKMVTRIGHTAHAQHPSHHREKLKIFIRKTTGNFLS